MRGCVWSVLFCQHSTVGFVSAWSRAKYCSQPGLIDTKFTWKNVFEDERFQEIFSIETVLNQISATRICLKIKELKVQLSYMLEQIIEHDVVDSLAIVAAVVYSQIWGYCEFNNVSGTFRITLGTRLLTIELCTHQQQWTWVFLYFSSQTISGQLLFVCSYFLKPIFSCDSNLASTNVPPSINLSMIKLFKFLSIFLSIYDSLW